jgi:hypothetical protein
MDGPVPPGPLISVFRAPGTPATAAVARVAEEPDSPPIGTVSMVPRPKATGPAVAPGPAAPPRAAIATTATSGTVRGPVPWRRRGRASAGRSPDRPVERPWTEGAVGWSPAGCPAAGSNEPVDPVELGEPLEGETADPAGSLEPDELAELGEPEDAGVASKAWKSPGGAPPEESRPPLDGVGTGDDPSDGGASCGSTATRSAGRIGGMASDLQ